MISISKYPSISDTKNRVSMIPWYQYPIRSDTRKKVSKQTMRCWGSCCTTARPVPLTQAQKPLASLIWYHLVYFRVISSSLCLKDCQGSFDWHLALYKSIQPTVKTWIHLSHCQPQRLCLTRVLNGFDTFCLHVALLALAFAIWSIPFFPFQLPWPTTVLQAVRTRPRLRSHHWVWPFEGVCELLSKFQGRCRCP